MRHISRTTMHPILLFSLLASSASTLSFNGQHVSSRFPIWMNGQRISGLPPPLSADEAASKAYVDGSSPDGCCSTTHASSSTLVCEDTVIAGNNLTCVVYARNERGTRAIVSEEDLPLFKLHLSGSAMENPLIVRSILLDTLDLVPLFQVIIPKTGVVDVSAEFYGETIGSTSSSSTSGPPSTQYSSVAFCEEPQRTLTTYSIICHINMRSNRNVDVSVGVMALELMSVATLLSGYGAADQVSFAAVVDGRADGTFVWNAVVPTSDEALNVNITYDGNDFLPFSAIISAVEPTCADWYTRFPDMDKDGWDAIDLATLDYPDGTSNSVTFSSSGSVGSIRSGSSIVDLDDHHGMTAGTGWNSHCEHRSTGVGPYVYTADFGSVVGKYGLLHSSLIAGVKAFAAAGYAGDGGGNYEPSTAADSWKLEGSLDSSAYTEIWSGTQSDFFSGGRPETYLTYPMPTAYVHCFESTALYRYFKITVNPVVVSTSGMIFCNWAMFPAVI